MAGEMTQIPRNEKKEKIVDLSTCLSLLYRALSFV